MALWKQIAREGRGRDLGKFGAARRVVAFAAVVGALNLEAAQIAMT